VTFYAHSKILTTWASVMPSMDGWRYEWMESFTMSFNICNLYLQGTFSLLWVHFWRTSWNISCFNCCWFELVILVRADELLFFFNKSFCSFPGMEMEILVIHQLNIHKHQSLPFSPGQKWSQMVWRIEIFKWLLNMLLKGLVFLFCEERGGLWTFLLVLLG
jgi:hypothetical protein